MEPLYIHDLKDEVTLAQVGGKGLNLHILTKAGFNVPPGFIVDTSAYREYTESNKLLEVIKENVKSVERNNLHEEESKRIRETFKRGVLSDKIKDEITAAYVNHGFHQVAVRSSATVEDLPEISFAGQHETYLNVYGIEQLIQAVVECWSSLWTPRAILYRERNQVPQYEANLAVVVQSMVQSESSGVMFTANPLTGVRTEIVINAAFGLGDQLVSGIIEPDEYIADKDSKCIKFRKFGAKLGGSPALIDAQIKALTEIGLKIHEIYGSPQDIEWSIVNDSIYILQSRPVTGLYPTLERVPVTPLRVYGSLGHVQGMLMPITPMGRDFIRGMLGNAQNVFGGRFSLKDNTLSTSAGSRLFVNLTGLIRNIRYQGLMKFVLNNVEPSLLRTLEQVIDDPRIEKVDKRPDIQTLSQLIKGFSPVLLRLFSTMLRPIHSRITTYKMIDETLTNWKKEQIEQITMGDHIRFIERILNAAPRTLLKIILPRTIAGIGSFYQVKIRAEKLGLNDDALNISRGLPYNVTTEMDLNLWDKSKRIRVDNEARSALLGELNEVVEEYKEKLLPSLLQEELEGFLSKYGVRGLYEIDIGSTRWIDDPSPIIQLMQTYMRINDPEKAPDTLFKKMAESAEDSLEKITVEARNQGGWVNEKLIRFFGFRLRNLAGFRETPKFFIINVMYIVRSSLLAIGKAQTTNGVLDSSWDVFYLHLNELPELDNGVDWKNIIAERKKQHNLDANRKPPMILLSDGHAYYGSAVLEGQRLIGSPVSPGVVEGIAHVMLNPTEETLNPGEILVCPATEPAWTPLFLVAAGLVMEVGGLMTHGSIVAREYGIPAVVGVNDATKLIRTGQRIIVDGGKGVINILE